MYNPPGVYSEKDFGGGLFLEKFFNLLGFFKKKIAKPPLNFPVHTKKIQNPSLEKFLDTPL